jgi:hypothetical protein
LLRREGRKMDKKKERGRGRKTEKRKRREKKVTKRNL